MACGINNTPRITQQVQQILKTLKPATPELQHLAGFIGQCYIFSDLSIKNPHTIIVESVVLLSHKRADSFINVKMEYDDDIYRAPDRVTYKLIQEYIEDKYNFKVHTAYIAEVKRSLGLPMYDAPNAVEELKYPYKPAPEFKVEAIKDALRHFNVI